MQPLYCIVKAFCLIFIIVVFSEIDCGEITDTQYLVECTRM